MSEGWLLSDGEVVASAVERPSLFSSIVPERAARSSDGATVFPARGVVVSGRVARPTSLVEVSADGIVARVRPLKPWRVVLVPVGVRLACVLSTAELERAGLRAGRQLEFRAAT
jgi:hypothetical protein